MSSKLNKNQIERFSRQIILKNIGALGQKKILDSKVPIHKVFKQANFIPQPRNIINTLCDDHTTKQSRSGQEV